MDLFHTIINSGPQSPPELTQPHPVAEVKVNDLTWLEYLERIANYTPSQLACRVYGLHPQSQALSGFEKWKAENKRWGFAE